MGTQLPWQGRVGARYIEGYFVVFCNIGDLAGTMSLWPIKYGPEVQGPEVQRSRVHISVHFLNSRCSFFEQYYSIVPLWYHA